MCPKNAGKTYQARIKITKDYREYNESKTFTSKLEVLKWIEIREKQIRSGLENKIDNTHTLGEAMERYRDEITPQKKGERWETHRINALLRDPNLPVEAILEKVTTDEIFKWRQLREISSSSKNRELSLIRTIFETARLEWRWVLDNPCKDIKRLPEPPSRDRRISEHEIQLLCEDLDFDLHNPIIKTQKQIVALIFLFALETAMRQSEITTLDWSQVNLREKYLTLLTTKNGEKRDVPLSSRAIKQSSH